MMGGMQQGMQQQQMMGAMGGMPQYQSCGAQAPQYRSCGAGAPQYQSCGAGGGGCSGAPQYQSCGAQAPPPAAAGGGGAAPNPFLAQLAQQLNQKGVNVSQFSKPQQ